MRKFLNPHQIIALVFGILASFWSCKTTSEDLTVSKLILDPADARIFVGQSATIIARIQPDNALNKRVKWISYSPAIATVSESGSVTALSVGTATIKAISEEGEKSAECAVTVEAGYMPVSSVSLNKETLQLTAAGAQETLTATVYPADATNKNIVWFSSNTKVATITNGIVTAKENGSSLIIATTESGAKAANCTVRVSY